MARLFGTDGVRGVANTELTPLLAMQLGAAGAYVLTEVTLHLPLVTTWESEFENSGLEGLVQGDAESDRTEPRTHTYTHAYSQPSIIYEYIEILKVTSSEPLSLGI